MSYYLVKSSNFIRSAKKLARKYPNFLIELNETLKILTSNLYDSRLKTHKLNGEMKEFWACSINYELRIIFQLVNAIDEESGNTVEAILLNNIGTHDEVY
ncbi:MAG: type II toxin-antitoxin system mRNA interferase toxin, RelE/StbE family [Candidatus Kapabacteria bacterium]|nr:type II toxin-antitoxin system mRNA interferase toxin, RelE/StbE family [Candidatus Kapabacteria bacterium]